MNVHEYQDIPIIFKNRIARGALIPHDVVLSQVNARLMRIKKAPSENQSSLIRIDVPKFDKAILSNYEIITEEKQPEKSQGLQFVSHTETKTLDVHVSSIQNRSRSMNRFINRVQKALTPQKSKKSELSPQKIIESVKKSRRSKISQIFTPKKKSYIL